MGSKMQPNKVLLDIEDCVSELKQQSLDGRTPINDDCTTLHRFQEKLELILLFGLTEKPGLLGPKKSYWNYICACFASSKRNHDGISFVKSVVALKTPLGRGRAFIRFCLTQKCLADTLQSCFMDQKISRDFYAERSLPVQEKLWSTLVTSLYELNELNFDLCAGHTELDISWPKFARKLFTTSDNEKFPHRNMSTPNLHAFSCQDEFISDKHDSDSSSFDNGSYSNNSAVNLGAVKLAETNDRLSQQNKSLQKEVEYLEKEKLRLLCDIQNLQKECQSLHHQLGKSHKEEQDVKSIQGKPEFKDTVSETTEIGSSPENTATVITMNMLKDCQEINLSTSVNPSLKSKIKSDSVQNSSECALQQNDTEMPALKVFNSDMYDKDTESSKINRNIYIPQNPIYVSELLLETKTVIDDIEDAIQKSDVTLAIPHISRLKRIRSHLEEKLSSEGDKSKSYLNFNNFVENCVSCIKNLTIKQENIINTLQEKVDLSIKGNQILYSKIRTLKELLRSYGFLKVTNDKEIEPESVLLPLDASSVSSKSCEDFSCDIAHDPVLKRIIVPLLPVLKSSFTKLSSLNEKMIELQFGLDLSQELNNNLIMRVQDQEMHLKGVTKEIEEAQQLVSVLKKQHRKLQSAEGILKYDLQEKRKLLTRLKQQLENTREDFNLVRIKNSKSEAEWQDLHKEFVQRQKQASEESGFVDDKGIEEHETVFSSSSCDYSFPEESTSEKDSVSKDSVEVPQPAKRKRLALLEEQCQSLYSSLMQSSKKRQEIDKRLENMCKTIEKNSEIIHSETFASDLPSESNFESVNGTVAQTSEDNCQNIFTNDTFTNSPHSSSDVGSLNSECSLCIPSMSNDANSSDSCYCDSSKADSCISFSPCKLQIGAFQPLTVNEQMKETSPLHDSDCTSSCNSECKEGDDLISSTECADLTISNVQNLQLQSMSHVDSILIKKKDLEESLKHLEIDSECVSTVEKRYPHSEKFDKLISTLQNEKKHLLNKVQELEKRILIISAELDQTTQQLILSKASKEHEVAALQFQLNTEALKYERSLKEFSEQSKGLENMKQRVTEQEHLILALEEALSEIHLDRESEKEQRWQESMSEFEEEHNKNEILLSQLEALKAYNQKDKDNMEAEILHLKQYSKELQKKLVKLLKEKDILWQRNNHLYHLQENKIDNRWMNDSEVTSCLTCKNNFSFILRKHHCRLCGRIFCYSCANNWLMTASSRKKIRTCNECFMQHLEMKKIVRRGSDVPNVDDDSEDEAERCNGDLSLIPASSCSFNSEVPSSVTNSVISLPITHKQSPPHFASAPDLRYVLKPTEVCSSSISLAEDNLRVTEGKIEIANDDVNRDCELNTEISSDDCTSITLEEDVPKTCRLKEISVDEIKESECGISGKLVVLSGERIDFPIFCENCPVILKWSFTSNFQGISLTLIHEDENCDNNSTIFYQATDKMQDQRELCFPGYYVFQFDNTFRTTEMEIQYVITIEHMR